MCDRKIRAQRGKERYVENKDDLRPNTEHLVSQIKNIIIVPLKEHQESSQSSREWVDGPQTKEARTTMMN